MKRLLTTFLIIIANQLYAQNFSTINFVISHLKQNTNFTISLNGQVVCSVKEKENIEYKIFSEGRITATIVSGSERIAKSIEVKKGNNYFLNVVFDEYEFTKLVIMDEEKGKKLLSKNTTTLKLEEDIKNPITILPLYGQNYSIINFVTNNCLKQFTFNIYLNEQLVGTIGQNENLEYKIFSEGRISIILISGSGRLTQLIDIKRGNAYYFEIKVDGWNVKYEVIEQAKGEELFCKNVNTIKAEEDKTHPIAKMPSTESEGPKQGTCFLISKQGYMITNYHVISGAKTIQVKGIGNDFSTLYGVDVIGYDIDLDLALLKLKNHNITFDSVPYKISFETNPQGTKSFVLGYPMTTSMGEEIKVTEGIISAKSGYKGSLSQYQFSAAIQPGNSGSPLFNDKGEVVGVINSKLRDAEGAGYAIKSQYLLTFLKLIDNIQIENNKGILYDMPLTEKISKFRNYIFIVKAE